MYKIKLRLTKSMNNLEEISSIKEIKYLHSIYNELKRKYPLSYPYFFKSISFSKKERISRIKNLYNKN